MQKYINDWEKDDDKDGKKTFVEFRDYCLEKDRINYHNKSALGDMGIANSIENIDPKLAELESKIEQQTVLMTKTVNALHSVQERNNALEAKLNNSANGVDIAKRMEEAKAEKDSTETVLLRQVLATLINNTPAPQKTAEEKKIDELTKLLAAAKKNGPGGRKKKDRPLSYDPDPNCKFYCSLCGVNETHPNDLCEMKHVKWWKPGKTFDNRCGCSKKNLHKWHLGVKGQPVQHD